MKKTFTITITVDVQEVNARPFGPCCIDGYTEDQLSRGVSLGCNCPYVNGVSVSGGRFDTTVSTGRCVSKTRSEGVSMGRSEGISLGRMGSASVSETNRAT